MSAVADVITPVEKLIFDELMACDARLTGSAVKVGILLRKFFNSEKGAAYPSVAKLSTLTKISPAQITRALNQLEKYGYIERIERGCFGKSTRYRVIFQASQEKALPSSMMGNMPSSMIDNTVKEDTFKLNKESDTENNKQSHLPCKIISLEKKFKREPSKNQDIEYLKRDGMTLKEDRALFEKALEGAPPDWNRDYIPKAWNGWKNLRHDISAMELVRLAEMDEGKTWPNVLFSKPHTYYIGDDSPYKLVPHYKEPIPRADAPFIPPYILERMENNPILASALAH